MPGIHSVDFRLPVKSCVTRIKAAAADALRNVLSRQWNSSA
jgi:hypothetical protein